MSAKLLYNLSDENPNLHKQIGCMNGIFHVFYRQHYPARRVVGHDHNTTLPPGETGDKDGETSLAIDKETEKTKKKAAKEKQRVSTESSSRPSFSSSPRSSSFSSADVSTASQVDPLPLTQTNNTANSNREPPNGSPRWCSLTHCDLRELVKGSIHRDTRAKDEAFPPQQPNTARASVSLLKEPLRSPSRSSIEWNEGRRVAHLKDSPRLSYDERDLRGNGYKTATKAREPPRLSLDSRSNSFRSSRTDMRSNSSLEDRNGQQEPATHRRTTSSVVAKLMGLEVLPVTTASEHDCLSGPSVTAYNNRQNHFCDSPRPSHVEAARHKSRGADSIKKMTPASKFPMEPAPWKQVDSPTADSALTVYGEIQKRLTQLKFEKSGKDLRALKQILEAMEKTHQLIDGRKDDTLSSTMLTSNGSSLVQRPQQPTPAVTVATSPSMEIRSSIVVMKPAQVLKKSGNLASALPQNVALPNLQVGNSRQIRKGFQGKQTAMDLTPRPGFYKGQLDSTVKNTRSRSLRSKQTSVESCSPKSAMAKSGRNQNSVSPRLQQKKLGFERQSRPTTPTSEASKTQRRLGRQQTEVPSPRRKQGTKSCNLLQSDDRLSDASSDLRSLSHQNDARSLRSDSNTSSFSNADIEVTSRYRFERPCDISEQHMHTPKQRSPDIPLLKPVKVTLEQPSPVSVLDVAFYEDDSPSPVRKVSTVFKEDDILNSEEAEWVKEDTSQTSTSLRRSSVLPENNRRVTYTDSELFECFTDEVAFTCDTKNADHKYISEILLASGFLRDLEYSMISIQLHQSRLPINPNLFFVLEQNHVSDSILQDGHGGKGIGQINNAEKIRRKFVFDTVNEILVQIFVAEGCIKPLIKSSPLMEKRSRGKYLLQTLCSEIDRLQANNSKCSLDNDEDIIWEDLQVQGMSWRDFEGETPAIVLDIERMIFKDLINEVVMSEVTAVRGRFSGQPRQLFPC
ncbi:PREDICTED: protein LONGIFOLIA 1-like [Tarenaya hassleriana]|uniref:protein LONGIFOLIA 1-like n=1 Tax=Tarenaya hassleriana TaxID=28532 RepID=UPI00053C1203|nr:PREDICTED: protein LONGIFOLIA 1-like [Tarenaya hassleriana]